MNLIINFIICFIILYLFFLSFINTNKDDNPIKYKLFIFSIITFIEICINLSEIVRNNCEFNIIKIIRKSILYGLFSVIGYAIYNDLNLFLFTDLFDQYNKNKYYKYLLMTSIIILTSFIFATLDIIITNNIIIDCKKNEENNYI